MRKIIFPIIFLLCASFASASLSDDLRLRHQYENNATDSSGNGYDGTEHDGVTYTQNDAFIGTYSLNLTGTSPKPYVSFPSLATMGITLNGDWTVCHAVKMGNAMDLGGASTWSGFEGDTYAYFEWNNVDANKIDFKYHDGSYKTTYSNELIQKERWYALCVSHQDSGNKFAIYLNGTVGTNNTDDGSLTTYSGSNFLGNRDYGQSTRELFFDELTIWNRTLSSSEIQEWSDDILSGQDPFDTSTALEIISYNCTSCDPPGNASPFTTDDTTPSFWVETNKDAVCAIADVDLNYTAMTENASYRNCTGTITHYCVLHPDDQLLINETDSLYIACRDTEGNENSSSTSGELIIDLSSYTETLGEDAIDAGIVTSTLTSPTVYENQQVYIRNSNNNQAVGTFDRLVIKDDQRWAFNYKTAIETLINELFNMTPIFYAAEYRDLTFQQVNDSVRTLIDETNN